MSRAQEIMFSLIAHGAFVAAIVFDGLRRESVGFLFYVLSIASAICVLPAFIYFVTNPRSFFLLPSRTRRSGRRYGFSRFRKSVLFFASWAYVAGWSVSWLLFAQWLPRAVASYSFMFGVTTSVLVAKYLFLSRDETTN